MLKSLIPTEDGSLSLLDAGTGELYHNRAGAYTEALCNYFRPSSASEILQRCGFLSILDVCFGLGYNSLVLLEKLLEQQLAGTVSIVGIESDSSVLELIPEVLTDERFGLLRGMFSCQPLKFKRQQVKIDALNIEFNLLNEDLRRYLPVSQGEFDLVFHDPFSPRKVPELWTVDIFEEYYRLLSKRKGKLLTYSLAGAVRDGLKEAGFAVFRTCAVGGKEGGTLAAVDPRFQLSNDEGGSSFQKVLGNSSQSSAIPYRDRTFCLSKEAILENRLKKQHQRLSRD